MAVSPLGEWVDGVSAQGDEEEGVDRIEIAYVPLPHLINWLRIGNLS